MSRRRGLLGEISWFQVTASVLASVTAAWIASRLGVAGTLIGAALGSFVVTITSAIYIRTLDHGKTLLIQTERGTVIERHVEEGEVQAALDEARDVDSPARAARFVDDPPRLHWRTIIVTAIVVLALALAAISTYELVAGRTLAGSGGTTIGDTFGGSKDEPQPDPTETTSPTVPAPTTASTPAPSATTSSPTPGEPSTSEPPPPTPTETTE